MKTILNDRYHRLPIRRIILVIFFLSLIKYAATAQVSGTYTVLQQPCNNDGKLAVEILSGMIPPFNYYYYNSSGGYNVHSNINSTHDTLFGISAPVTYVYVTPSIGTGSLYYNTAVSTMYPPFTVDPPILTNAVCPNLTGSASLTINGGASPASVQWFYGSYSGFGPYVGSGNPMVLAPGDYAATVTDAS